uniref:immunoglobulin superfamily containing leucine-rich repeat protein-like n=1 Tax=Pogona vitticeps TaxID=103695 RepID=UPI003BB9737C
MGEKTMDPLLFFLTVLLFVGTQSCPEVCKCVAKKKYGRHIADCSYKELQAVPIGLPSNATTLTLSVNRITSLRVDSFEDLVDLQALWLSYNEVSTIAKGTFAFLVQLRAIDLSHNRITDFPWGDLSNLTALQQLKLSSNLLEKVPSDAFHTLKDLRSLWLSDNQLAVLSEGTFDSMPLLSLLQISHNPWNCSCKIWWLKAWMENTSVIPEKESITCASPERMKGLVFGRSLPMDCMRPSVQVVYHSSLGSSILHGGLSILLHCTAVGKPPPEIRWKIQTSSQNVAINGPNIEEGNNSLADVTSKHSKGVHFLVFKNGSMVISKFSKADEGIYTCQALNDVGSREESVSIALASSENPADQLENNIQASKPESKPCDREEHSKSEEKIVVLYLPPILPKTSSSVRVLWPWAALLLSSLLALCS